MIVQLWQRHCLGNDSSTRSWMSGVRWGACHGIGAGLLGGGIDLAVVGLLFAVMLMGYWTEILVIAAS
jgi:hypothetical protein